MKRIAHALLPAAVLVLAAILVPIPAARAQGEASGGWVWSRYFEGEGHTVVVDGSGVYVGGSHYGVAYLLKYDADGRQVWSRGLGELAGDIKVAVNGSTLYTIGRMPRSMTADMILQAFDPGEGRALWEYRFETEWWEKPVGIAADASGVYVVGSSHDRMAYPAVWSFFIQKYDTDGNEVWTRIPAYPAADGISGVALDASGVYVVGKVAADRALWKFDFDGRHVWARQFKIGGGEGMPSVAADPSGVYVVGTTTGALPNQTSSGGDDAFIRKYSSDGDELWTRQFGSPGVPGTPAGDSAHTVAVTEHGVYVGGIIRLYTSSDAFIRKFDSVSGGDLWGLQYRWSVGALDVAVADTGVYLTRHSDQASWGYLVRIGETPGPPRELQATPGEAHTRLEWASPDFNGGLPVKGYQIYRGTDPTSLQQVAFERAELSTYMDTDVTNQVTYYYAVSAVNEIGEGPRSPLVATTPGTPPVVANPGPPPPDFVLFGSLAVLGAALILAIYWLRGIRSPGRDPVEGGSLHRFVRSQRPLDVAIRTERVSP